MSKWPEECATRKVYDGSTLASSVQLPSMNVSSRRSTRNSGRPGSTRGSAVTSSLGGGRGATDAGVVSDEPAGAVIAECYKISKSPTLDEGVMNAMAANSITLIKVRQRSLLRSSRGPNCRTDNCPTSTTLRATKVTLHNVVHFAFISRLSSS